MAADFLLFFPHFPSESKSYLSATFSLFWPEAQNGFVPGALGVQQLLDKVFLVSLSAFPSFPRILGLRQKMPLVILCHRSRSQIVSHQRLQPKHTLQSQGLLQKERFPDLFVLVFGGDFLAFLFKKPHVHDLFRPQFWGRKWLHQFYGRLAFFGSFCWKTPCP